MPEVSRFYGIIIKIYYADHLPAHFHAEYAEHEGLFHIETLALITGDLPARAQSLVIEWASRHRSEIREAWVRASNMQPPGKIEPLP